MGFEKSRAACHELTDNDVEFWSGYVARLRDIGSDLCQVACPRHTARPEGTALAQWLLLLEDGGSLQNRNSGGGHR